MSETCRRRARFPVLVALAIALAPTFVPAGAGSAPPPAPGAGRPVRVVSLSFKAGRAHEEVLAVLEREAARGTDLVLLPETWRGQNDRSREPIDGPTVKALARIAARHRTYVVSPLDIERGGRRFNTAVVIERAGKVVGAYDKAFPYWSEYRHRQPVDPGAEPAVVKTDFGTIGVAICFDVNFPEVWDALARKGAELVLWPSAYSAGTHLAAYALLHHYYIVTATWSGDAQVYDIDGRRLLDERAERADAITVTRVTLDLDRGIYHQNFNDVPGFIKKHAGSVMVDRALEREQWTIVRATRPGVSARALARAFGLEELRDYVTRSRDAINRRRADAWAAREPRSP
jgi:predicted amidohydrolase